MKQTDSVFVPNALTLIEEAIHLLRRSRLKIGMDYYTGSLPFILGLLYFWSDMSRNPYASHYCSPAAAGLALLFVWMKYWHVRFCRNLWNTLHDTPSEKQPLAAELAVTARQAIVHATGFIVQPVALIIVFPLAWTYAFYQNATVMASPHSKDLKTLYKNASRQSMLWPGQNHLILCIVCFFAVIVFCNLAVVVMILPYLLKKLTGIETVFTISGLHAMTNTTFLAIICALTYLCVDPVIKAIYTLRCFYSESRFSGDDMRIHLKPYLKTGVMMVTLWMTVSLPLDVAMARETGLDKQNLKAAEMIAYGQKLDQSIEEVLQKPRFAWRMPREKMENKEKEKKGWLKTGVKWLVNQLEGIFAAIGQGLDSLVDWVKNLFPKIHYEPEKNKFVGTIIRVIFGGIAGAAIILSLVLLLRYLRSNALKKTSDIEPENFSRTIDLNDETVTADKLPYDQWMSLAKECMRAQDLRQALRALYLAILAQMGDKNKIVIARYKSNQDYLGELSVHAHAEPELFDLFAACVKMFERFWYGMYPVAVDKVNRFKSYQERIDKLVQQEY